MIYCPIREKYVEQNDCCVLCKFYEEIEDDCKREEEEIND